MFLPRSLAKIQYSGSICDREVACSAPDSKGSNFEFCVWRAVSSHSSHHPHDVHLAQYTYSPNVHKSGLKPHSFHFILINYYNILSRTCTVWIWIDFENFIIPLLFLDDCKAVRIAGVSDALHVLNGLYMTMSTYSCEGRPAFGQTAVIHPNYLYYHQADDYTYVCRRTQLVEPKLNKAFNRQVFI